MSVVLLYYGGILHMQSLQKPPFSSGWLYKTPRLFIILGFAFIYLIGWGALVPQVSATALSMPGGNVSDPVVRQVDIARPAVVRIITKIDGRLTVRFTATSPVVTFPQGGGSYPVELSGSGAFISAHGDILTADHVVNPPHDQELNDALYQIAAQDIADYINAHFQVTQPFSADDVVADLEAGVFASTPQYGQTESRVYLSTAFSGPINAARFSEIPSSDYATVDQIEAQSSFDAMDVAIVHVSGMDDMPSIQLGDSSQVAEQDNLTIIGYPGLGDVSASPTNLLTSSINKIYVSAIKTTDSGAPVIQVGGNVEHGDSGAPALDSNGNIVGIVSFGLFDPSGSGETSFLQASNSARELIQEQNINTAPGAFQRAWTQAFDDYASNAAGHWHKAVRELQGLVDTYKGFLGVTSYLTYAQDQASRERLPSATPSSAANPTLIVVLILLALIVVAAMLFIIMKRRPRPALATGVSQFVPAPMGGYPPQQNGVSSVYPPRPESYSSPQQGFGWTSGVYPPVPSAYASATWTEQPAHGIPQTPQPVASEFSPVPIVSVSSPEHGSAPFPLPPDTPLPAEENSQEATGERSLPPAWLPPIPMSEIDPSSSNGETSSAAASTPELSPAPANSEEKTLLTPPPVARSFAVPRRPSPLATSETTETAPADSLGVQKWVAPCGHTNAPDVRFCRVCGLPIGPSE
jgi:S1-C subfamily serine protease